MIPQTGPCPKTVILILPQKEKDLPRVAYLGETLRRAQGNTVGPTFEAKLPTCCRREGLKRA